MYVTYLSTRQALQTVSAIETVPSSRANILPIKWIRGSCGRISVGILIAYASSLTFESDSFSDLLSGTNVLCRSSRQM